MNLKSVWVGALILLIIISLFLVTDSYIFEYPVMMTIFLFAYISFWAHELSHVLAGKLKNRQWAAVGFIYLIFPTGVFLNPSAEKEKHNRFVTQGGVVGTFLVGLLLVSIFIIAGVWPVWSWWLGLLFVLAIKIVAGYDDLERIFSTDPSERTKERMTKTLERANLEDWSFICLVGDWKKWLDDKELEEETRRKLEEKTLGKIS